jgi:hypothetical protein
LEALRLDLLEAVMVRLPVDFGEFDAAIVDSQT